jgi:hypothetical protein
MKHTLNCISYNISITEIVGLLPWSTGKDARLSQFQIEKYFKRRQNFKGAWFPPKRKYRSRTTSRGEYDIVASM